ncbi:MAG TPA: glycoside hydrolase family 16 protein [Stellaceae bacterium]
MLTRRSVLGSIAAAPAILRAGAASAEPGPPRQARAAGMTTLAYADDFDSMSTIDVTGKAKAHGQYKWYNAGDYAGPRNAYSVRDSMLTIAVPAGGAAAEIGTCNARHAGVSFQYFYAESRFAWEPVDNNWPCFWGICIEHFDGTGDGGLGMELDVVEMGGRSFIPGSGSSPGMLTTLHTTAPGAPTVNKHSFGVKLDFDPKQLNTYGALWVPGRVMWYFNDRLISSYDYHQPYWDGPHNHIALGFGSNGAWPNSSPPAWKMHVDWVRIWTGSMSSIRRS